MKLKFNLGLVMAFKNIQRDYQNKMNLSSIDSWHKYSKQAGLSGKDQTFSNFDYADMIPTEHEAVYIEDIRGWHRKLELIKL